MENQGSGCQGRSHLSPFAPTDGPPGETGADRVHRIPVHGRGMTGQFRWRSLGSAVQDVPERRTVTPTARGLKERYGAMRVQWEPARTRRDRVAGHKMIGGEGRNRAELPARSISRLNHSAADTSVSAALVRSNTGFKTGIKRTMRSHFLQGPAVSNTFGARFGARTILARTSSFPPGRASAIAPAVWLRSAHTPLGAVAQP